jgi:PAS domain S-box-containing protein
MFDPILWLFDTSGFVPRWRCGHWYEELGWLHIVSDLLIWLAYLAIPAVLVFFIRRRRDMPFPRIIWLFGAFILACGTTHLIEAVIFWYPVYRLAGVIKLITAVVSWLTVVALVPIVPRALAMRTPGQLDAEVKARTRELLEANTSLQREVHERLKAERQLREQQEWLQVILQSVGEGIIATDVRGQITFLNPAATSLIGYTQGVAAGRALEEVFHAEDFNLAPDTSDIVHSKDLTPANQKLLKSRDGSERIVESWITPIRIDDAVFAGAVVAFRDITERVNAERALLEASQRFERTVSAISDLFVAFDRDWRYIFLNEKAAAFTGHKPADLMGKCVWALFPDSVGGRFYNEMMEAATTQAIRCFEATYPTGRCYEHRAYPHADGVSVFSSDITARKQSEDSLRLHDRAISAANQGILITDALMADNPIIYASPGFERITGYSAADSIGRNCRFLQGPETDPRAVARIRDAIQSGKSCTVEVLNYRKDGSSFWNELSISPVRDEANRLTHFVGVQADVTARRAMSEQLRQAQKMESVGRLAGGVAHDFNNMLTIINGCSELVLKGMDVNDPSYELLKEVKTAGERAASLTRQLLAFSRQQLIAPQVVSFNEVVSHTKGMLQRLLGEDIELVINLKPELPAVCADRGQLEQILVNLAVNARDAMPQGGRLTIETASICKADAIIKDRMNAGFDKYVVLAVRDTGCGFDPSIADRLFEPFFTTKSVGDGIGLGLAVVHGIVAQAAGFVDVTTEPHKGTRFRVFLPAMTENIPTATTNDQPERGELLHGTERVLLVEDESGLRAFAHKVLTDCGYQVLDAADGGHAIQLAARQEESIDLLVTDVVMPGIGGREVAAEIRKSHPSAAVLFMSGYTDDAVMRNGIFQDEVEFLQKPFSPVAFSHKVRQLLDERNHETSTNGGA